MDWRWLGRALRHAAFARRSWTVPAHTRAHVRVFRASSELLLDYHDATYERTAGYLEKLSAEDLARELNEPQHQPQQNNGTLLTEWTNSTALGNCLDGGYGLKHFVHLVNNVP